MALAEEDGTAASRGAAMSSFLGGRPPPSRRVRGRHVSDDGSLVERAAGRRAQQHPAGVVADVLP
eukprot:1735604-Prymnesium_polylepis.1